MNGFVNRDCIGSESLDLVNPGECTGSFQSKLWYAVYTIVRHEKAVNTLLMGYNIETFLPLRVAFSQWKDRRKKVCLPLFPGYIFVRITDKDLTSVFKILNTKGVVRILSSNGNLQAIPSEQIESVKRLQETNLECDPYQYMVKGKEVTLVNGPLRGITGKITEKQGQKLLILSIDIIKRSVRVKVDPADVELI